MRAGNRLGCVFVVAVAVLMAWGSAAPARDPVVLPSVTVELAAPYDKVWDATVLSLGHLVNPAGAEKAKGVLTTDQFFFTFPIGTEASQTMLVKLTVSLRRADAQRTSVQVQPFVFSMTVDGVMPGPTNNPWTDFIARLRANLGLRS